MDRESVARIMEEAKKLWHDELWGTNIELEWEYGDKQLVINVCSWGFGGSREYVDGIRVDHGLGMALRDLKRIPIVRVKVAVAYALARQARERLRYEVSYMFRAASYDSSISYEECLEVIQAGHEDGRDMDWECHMIHERHVAALMMMVLWERNRGQVQF